MNHIKHFLILGILFGLVACANPSQPQFAAASAAPDFEIEAEWDLEEDHGIPVNINLDGRLELKFTVNDLWTEPAYLQQIHHDTVFLMLGLVEMISGHQFKIDLQDPNIKFVSVSQSYETSLTLMDEGPHMDLTDWMHYTSDWQPLSVEDWQFSTLEYDQYDYQRFPEVGPMEIMAAVKARVNDPKWVKLAEKCANPLSYPCGVSISRYFLKLEIQDFQDQVTERIVVFEVPMGC